MLVVIILAQLSLPTPLPPVLELAQGFSGSAAPPRCQRRGESGQDLGSPLAMYCVWNAAGPGMEAGKLVATISSPGGPTLVQWEVPFVEPLRAKSMADSLGRYLERHGFQPKTCGDGDFPVGRFLAVQWRGQGLAVQVGHLVPSAGYQAKLLVVATDTPSTIRPVLCQ